MTRRDRELQRKYGITEHEYERKFACQGGLCAICCRPPKTRRLHVDHDHRTKRVRGLLCFRCNRYYVSKLNLDMARRVVRYLKRYEPVEMP